MLLLALAIYSAKGTSHRIESTNHTDRLSRFIDYSKNARNDVFIPNTNFWAREIDFSCASPWNSISGSLRAGTLISKRHVVYAAHFPLSMGARIVFVDNEGNVCPCYLDKSKQVAGTDIMIGALNAEITPNIKPAKLLSFDFIKHLDNRGAGLPVATFNRQEKAYYTEANALPTNRLPRGYARSSKPIDDELKSLRERIVIGDSGNPAFLLLNGSPILLYCLHFGGCGSGPALHLYANEIQLVMDELCPGYKLEFYDFKSACGK